MPKASVRNLEIEYETFGASSNPALLLIIGLGGQMIAASRMGKKMSE